MKENVLYEEFIGDAHHYYEANLFEQASLQAGKALLFATTREEEDYARELTITYRECFYHYGNQFYCRIPVGW